MAKRTKKKECSQGYNCGATCIERKDSCIKNLTPEMNAAADKFLKLIQDSQSEFESLSSGQKSVRTKKQAKFESLDQAQRYLKYHNEMREIEELKDSDAINKKLKELEETPWSANPIYKMFDGGALSTEKAYKEKRSQSDQIAEALIENLPNEIFSQISEKGSPCSRPPGKQAEYCGKKGSERKGMLRERGKAILSNYLMFDMKDPMTGNIASWRDLQPDHVITQSSAGAKADTFTNLNIVYGAYNQVKKAGEWSSVKKSLEKVATKEGFESNKKASDDKARKQIEDQKKHFDNLTILKDSDSNEKKLKYLEDSIKTTGDAQNVLRGLVAAKKGVPPSEYQAPRPFRETSRGSSSWGSKNSINYINKKLLGLNKDITDEEKKSFNKDIETSNIIRVKKPNKKEITEQTIFDLYNG